MTQEELYGKIVEMYTEANDVRIKVLEVSEALENLLAEIERTGFEEGVVESYWDKRDRDLLPPW